MSRKSLVPVNVPALSSAPTLPTLRTGDLYFNTSDSTLYSYNGTTWAASGGGGGGSSVTVSDSVPSSPTSGSMWFESDTGKFFVYYDNFWVEIGAVGLTGAGYGSTTSTTSITIGAASPAFTVTSVGAFVVGQRVRVFGTTPSNFIEGTIASIAGLVITVTSDFTGGSGTYSSWTFSATSSQPPLSSATPQALGSASAGVGSSASKDDHVHPTTGLAVLASSNTFTNNQLVSVDSSNNAFEIRQIGAGNAFVVEDSVNPDATPFVVTASGQVFVGRTTANGLANYNRAIQIEGNSAATVGLSTIRNSNDVNAPAIEFAKSRATTSGGVTTVTGGDNLGLLSFGGTDGTSLLAGAAQIAIAVDNTVSTGIIPTRISILTTPVSGGLVERMRIDSNGSVFIGTNVATGQNTGGLTIQGKDIEIMTIMQVF